MQGDIKLDGVIVRVEGNYLYLTATDLLLDSAARRKRAGGHRRSLVHGFNDELVINFNRDYPGGVTIEGRVRFPQKLAASEIEIEDEEWSVVEAPVVEAPVEEGGILPPKLRFRRLRRNLADVVAELRREVRSLSARLEALEKRG